jgi:eukaryotic-like serine/threonine-protein kinase
MPDTTPHIKELLLEALELAPAERDAFLNSATRDEQILREVRDLLAAHEQAGAFLDARPIAPDGLDAVGGPDDEVGSMIGRYRLVRLIGEGGFGRVFLAEQRDPIERQVALKIIKLGMDTRRVIARFETERQTLAMMEHPGIARVLDAGADPRGRPYFVMELVNGVPITTYCDNERLDIEARLRLFMQVCAAVQHAHAKGIIHRDLKPGNILVERVDSSGSSHADEGNVTLPAVRPKVIDFGIAKAMRGRLANRTLLTESHQLLGTPEYMSPEQADHDAIDIDTRSDVYSLGAVLYELLTGSTALSMSSRKRLSSHDDMQRMIREDEPERPSMKLSRLPGLADVASQRDAEPRRLVSQLRGDLDRIVLKAMERDRERRYGSPAELAEDLRRHLEHEPVSASPPGMGYLARKFVRRHRATVIVGALLALALVGGVIGTSIGLVQARHAAQRAQTAADETAAVNDFMREFLTSVDPDEDGAEVALIDVLDEASAAAHDRFAEYPQLEAQVRNLLGQVNLRLSRLPEAEAEYRRCEELWRVAVGADDPRSLEARVNVGLALTQRGRGREAEQYLGEILPHLERTLGPNHTTTLQGCIVAAEILRQRGRLDESEALLRQGLVRSHVAGVEEHMLVALHNTLTGVLRAQVERADTAGKAAAIEAYRASAERLMELGMRQGKRGRWFVRAARLNLADVARARGDWADAATQARALLEETAGSLGECHNVRIAAMGTLAQAESRMGEAREPADLYLRIIACTRVSSRDDLLLLAHLCDALPILSRDARYAEGEGAAREILQIFHASGEGHVGTLLYQTYLAHFISRQNRLDEAQALFDSAFAQAGDANVSLERLMLEVAYAGHLIRRGRFADAEQRLLYVQDHADLRTGLSPQYPEEIVEQFVALYQAWGQSDKLAEYQSLRDELLEAAQDPEPTDG